MKLLTTFIITLLLVFTGCNRQNRITDSECNNEIPEPEHVVVCEPTAPSLSIPHRPWQERTVAYKNVGLKHPMLYLKGPYEKRGSNDGYFKTWDCDSAISFGVSPAIFVGNVIAWPIHLVQTPPWKKQTSRSGYPVQQPVSALPAEPSRAASKNVTRHEAAIGGL
jgi:hypothetical protein